MRRRRILAALLAVVTFATVSVGAVSALKSRMPSGVQVVSYDSNTDYMAEMLACADDGSEYALLLGGIYETQRNLKIADIGKYTQTNYFNSPDANVVRGNIGLAQQKVCFTDTDVLMLAKTMYLEARGINSKTELSCICWTILNRVDAGYASTIAGVVTAPGQFAYSANAKTVNDYGINLAVLAEDVLHRWSREKNGETNVGRTLPKDYLWYSGSNGHNWFRNSFRGGAIWNYSLPSPYES